MLSYDRFICHDSVTSQLSQPEETIVWSIQLIVVPTITSIQQMLKNPRLLLEACEDTRELLCFASGRSKIG